MTVAMAERVEAIVEPELLVWARQKAGFEIDMAAKKANVVPSSLAAWEAGERRPSVKSLRRLGRVYGRPLAFFYLPEPPRDFQPIKDYRRPHGQDERRPSPELLGEIRAAYERREIALELLIDSGEPPPPIELRAEVEDDREQTAKRIRQALGVTIDEQMAWRDSRTAFNAWRAAIENLGVLAVQMTEVDADEARGFSIAETKLPVVVANNSDPPQARSFTLMHELTHVALRAGGICDLSDYGGIEPFCNYVAGAVLIPTTALLNERLVREHDATPEWSDEDLHTLELRFGVSREAVLRRLLILNRTDDDFYNRTRQRLRRQYDQARLERRGEQGGGIPPSTKALIRSGNLFAHLVLSSHSHGAITASDVATYLGVRYKHVPKIEQTVFPGLAP